MALQVRRNSSVKVRVITTLMMAFALVAQPMYGLVSSQVANAIAKATPTITKPTARQWFKTAPIKTEWSSVSGSSDIDHYQIAYSYDDGHTFGGSDCPELTTIEGKVVSGCRDVYGTSRDHSPAHNEQGGVTIWVRAIDSAGDAGLWSKSVHYYYDPTAPDTDIIAPTGAVGNSFTVRGDASDNLSLNRAYVQLINRQDNQRYGRATINLIGEGTDAHWSKTYDADKQNLPDGTYAAHVSITDMAGNTSTAGWTDNFTVDSTVPTVDLATPINNAVNPVEYTIKAHDVSGIDSVTAILRTTTAANGSEVKVECGKTIDAGGNTNFEKTCQLPNDMADGEYNIRYNAKDTLGNQTVSKQINFTVDHTAPVISANVTDGQTLSGIQDIVQTVEDDNPQILNFYLRNMATGEIAKIAGKEVQANDNHSKDGVLELKSLDTTKLSNGKYTFVFGAKDAVGNRSTTLKVGVVVNNPQPVVVGENFNTHDGEDYKGINVGFSIANFKTVSDVSVSLFNEAGELLVTNSPDAEGKLLALIASDVKQHSTPFIITPGIYLEEFWTLGNRNWMVADKPATAIVTVTGTNNAGVEVSEKATLPLLTEPNEWTFESLLPKISTPPATDSGNETEDTLNGGQNPGSEASRAAANGSDEEDDDSEVSTPFARGTAAGNLFAANFAVAGQNSDDEDEDVKEEDAAVLGTQDTGTPLSNTGAIVADDAGFSLSGLSWYWWLGILGAAVAGWLWIAAGIRRMRGTDI